MTYTDMKTCPVCTAPAPFWPNIRVMGPEFVSPAGFKAAYLSDYVKCKVCGLIFQDPMPDMTDWYESGEYRKHLAGSAESNDAADFERSKRNLATIVGTGREIKSYLDIGCGRGALMDLVYDEFHPVVFGVDPDPDYPATKHSVARTLPDVIGLFDFITMIHTLEHVSNPVEYLKDIGKLLIYDGILMVQVPSQSPTAVSPFRLAHLLVFDTMSLSQTMKQAGFIVDRCVVDNDLTILAHKKV